MTLFIIDQQKSYRHLGWNELLGRLAALGLLYKLGRSKWAGNFVHGFWLIQKLDHSKNLTKNPIILWSNFFALGSLSYDKFLKLHLFSSDNAQWKLIKIMHDYIINLKFVLQNFLDRWNCSKFYAPRLKVCTYAQNNVVLSMVLVSNFCILVAFFNFQF